MLNSPCRQIKKFPAPILNPKLDQEGSSAAAGSAERVGKSLQAFHPNCFHAHAPGKPYPIEVRTAEVEEGV